MTVLPPDGSNDRIAASAEGMKFMVVEGDAERQTVITTVFPMEKIGGPERVAFRVFRITGGMANILT